MRIHNKLLLTLLVVFCSIQIFSFGFNASDFYQLDKMPKIKSGTEDIFIDGDRVFLYIDDGYPNSDEADRLDDLHDDVFINLFVETYPSSDQVDILNTIDQPVRLIFWDLDDNTISYPGSSSVARINDLNSNFSFMIINDFYPDSGDVDDLNDLNEGILLSLISNYIPYTADIWDLNDLSSKHSLRLNMYDYPTTYGEVDDLNDLDEDAELIFLSTYAPSYTEMFFCNYIDSRHEIICNVIDYPSEYEVDYIFDEFDEDITLIIERQDQSMDWPDDAASDNLRDLDNRHKIEIYGHSYPGGSDAKELNDIGDPLDVNIVESDYPSLEYDVPRINDLSENSHPELNVSDYFTSAEKDILLQINREYDLNIYETVFPSTSQVTEINDYVNKCLNGFNDSLYVSNTLPSSVYTNDTISGEIVFQNDGTSQWSSSNNYKLSYWNSADPSNITYFALPQTTDAGASATFQVSITAPSSTGTLTTNWQVVEEGVESFGDVFIKDIIITTPPEVNNAQYISDTIPAEVPLDKDTLVSVTMKNTGNTTWTAAEKYRLGINGDWSPLGAPGRVDVPNSVIPNAEVTFTFTIHPTQAGDFSIELKMLEEFVHWFGEGTNKNISSVNETSVCEEVFEIYN